MSQTLSYDISRGNVWTKRSGVALSKSRVEQVIEEVYDEFSGDAPIQQHLVEFSAYYQLNHRAVASNMAALWTLKQFDYLREAALGETAIRTKGMIAVNMVVAEISGGDLSAYLDEPFQGMAVLPILYRRWKTAKNGEAIPPLYL